MTIKFNLRSQPIQSKYLPTPIIDKDVSIKFVGEVIHLLVMQKIDIGSVKNHRHVNFMPKHGAFLAS